MALTLTHNARVEPEPAASTSYPSAPGASHRHGHDIHCICSSAGEGHGRESEWVQVHGARHEMETRPSTHNRTTDVRWWLGWCLTPHRTEVGKVAKTHSTQRTANERRMLTLTMHIARFPFPYRRDYTITSIGAVFLRRTPPASGAMRAPSDHNCTSQLHSPLHTVYSDEASLFSVVISAGSSRTSGAISLRHGEWLNYLDRARVFLLSRAD